MTVVSFRLTATFCERACLGPQEKRRTGPSRVGQGFWVYGIQGSSKLGIRYIYAEMWVLRISFVLLTTNFGYNVL